MKPIRRRCYRLIDIRYFKQTPACALPGEINPLRVFGPNKRSHPTIEVLSQILLLPRLAVVEHQAEAVALVSRTLLGAVGDVASIGRIERRRVAGRIIGGDVLRRPSADRDD